MAKKSGFEPIGNPLNIPKSCNNIEHNPPSHIAIPQGQQYRHVCPGCGKEFILRNEVYYQEAVCIK